MVEDPSISPRDIIENFKFAYAKVNNSEPFIVYRGNHWYIVNGEAVHRAMVIREIARLRGVAQKQTLRTTDRSLLNRLINKLRGL
ncbi:MAG: hypothetical protein IPK19_16280 [Chloroflexi bacterium]|nr:hypothetical protein [Chloroflexota bacterium]